MSFNNKINDLNILNNSCLQNIKEKITEGRGKGRKNASSNIKKNEAHKNS